MVASLLHLPHAESPAGIKDQSQQPPFQQASYGQQPYGHQQGYGAPPLPPGWISQWDPNSQRYYYLEQATGRTQWDPPHQSFPPPGGPPMGAPGQGQQGASGGYYSQETKHVIEDTHGGGQKEVIEKKEKKSGKGGMLAAGAGGLAVGAVGGAMIGHAMGMFLSLTINHSLT